MKPRPALTNSTSAALTARSNLACGPNAVTVDVGSARAASPAMNIQIASTPIAAPKKRATTKGLGSSIVEDMLDFIFCLGEAPKQKAKSGHPYVKGVSAPAGPGLEWQDENRWKLLQGKRLTIGRKHGDQNVAVTGDFRNIAATLSSFRKISVNS
jgi:hypothetical protein